jgi:hypothetical protein
MQLRIFVSQECAVGQDHKPAEMGGEERNLSGRKKRMKALPYGPLMAELAATAAVPVATHAPTGA